MDVDSNYPIDLPEVNRMVDTSEVLVIGFTLFRERLLVDARHDANEGPRIMVVPPASSMRERRRYLRRLRPRFALPEEVIFFTWPRPISSLERLGVWERIVERALNSGHSGVLEDCQRALRDLKRLEQGGIIAAVKGEGYHDLWRSDGGS